MIPKSGYRFSEKIMLQQYGSHWCAGTGKAFMRKSMLCTAVAISLSAAPASADKEQWGFVKSDRNVLLFFGVPESEAVTLSFICEPKRGRIAVVTTALPPTTRPGRPGRIRLSNGSSSLDYAGRTARDNDDAAVHVAASTAIDPRLFGLLETGTSLRIEALGARETVPLAGISGPLSQMRKACR